METKMHLPTKAAIVAYAGDLSLILAFIAGLPYTMGEMADILPPKGKIWVTGSAAIAAALLKLVQRFMERAQGKADAQNIAQNAQEISTVKGAVTPPQPK